MSQTLGEKLSSHLLAQSGLFAHSNGHQSTEYSYWHSAAVTHLKMYHLDNQEVQGLPQDSKHQVDKHHLFL